MGAVSMVHLYVLTQTKQGTWGGVSHHRRAFLALQRGGLGGGRDFQSPCVASKETGPHSVALPDIHSKEGEWGNCVWLRQGPPRNGGLCGGETREGGADAHCSLVDPPLWVVAVS